jgi:uncharacterized Zn finger protein
VILEGQTLAKTWWGKAWNKNLERYADYANRIGRGRSYVRHGAVLDLKIQPGKVSGLVMGSTSTPYKVAITIKPIPPKQWQDIKNQCRGKMDSIRQLMSGKLPKELEALFTQKGKGLFPSPKEIGLNCSCPDWAVMCKHVAAVLYGIGARLDDDPGLFFILRKAKVNDLVAETVQESKKDLLNRSGKKSSRIIDDKSRNLSDMFGIDLDTDDLPSLPPAKTKPVRPKAARAKKKSSQPPVTPKDTHASKIRNAAGIETLFKRRTKRHTAVAEVIEKSDMTPQKVRNTLYNLVKKGKLERVSRGAYKWVRSEKH